MWNYSFKVWIDFISVCLFGYWLCEEFKWHDVIAHDICSTLFMQVTDLWISLILCLLGSIKLDMSPVHVTPSACLSTELIPLIPVAEKNTRLTKEVLEFSSSEVYVPHSIYRWVITEWSHTFTLWDMAFYIHSYSTQGKEIRFLFLFFWSKSLYIFVSISSRLSE